MAKEKTKERISVVVIGHVDSGKSTTTGHLLFKLGGIDERTVAKYQKESEEMGKGSFGFAWIFDKLKTERERGITIDICLKQFETSRYDVTVIDAPGHRDFIKNMITGTAQADAAILIISAAAGEFEAGISKDGQTKMHATLAYILGIKQVIVCINKMDSPSVNWNHDRYKEIEEEVKKFMKRIGYAPETYPIIPISGYRGDNLVQPSEKAAWYKGFSYEYRTKNSKETKTGKTVSDAIDCVELPPRPTDKPLRIPISGVLKISGIGTVVTGKVESGVIKPGMLLAFAPTGATAEVKSIERHNQKLIEGSPGENIGFNIKNLNGEISKGHIVSDAKNDPARGCVSFTARLIIMDHPGEIRNTYSPVIDCHTSHVSCKFAKLIEKFDKSGALLETNPESIKKDDSAVVTLVPAKPLCVEPFKTFPALGRIAVRDMKTTVAVGIVTAVEYVDPSNVSKSTKVGKK